jgi:hypothetical protein
VCISSSSSVSSSSSSSILFKSPSTNLVVYTPGSLIFCLLLSPRLLVSMPP